MAGYMTISIEKFARFIPGYLLDKPGRVFYSGRKAFESPSRLYVLGLNSAGDPKKKKDTIKDNINKVSNPLEPEKWSRYRCVPDAYHSGVINLLKSLGEEPEDVPASNLVFQRSKRPKDLPDFRMLVQECWPFHQAVIDELKVRVVVCMGAEGREDVRNMLKVNSLPLDSFTEPNRPSWQSLTYRNAEGLVLVQLTHPSRAWKSRATDPTALVKRAIKWTSTNPS